MTKRDKIIAAFERKGFIKVDVRTRKYICYKSPNAERYYFVGSHGAVRYNISPNSSSSMSVTLKQSFLEESNT